MSEPLLGHEKPIMTPPRQRDPMVEGCGGCLLVITMWLIVSWAVTQLTPR